MVAAKRIRKRLPQKMGAMTMISSGTTGLNYLAVSLGKLQKLTQLNGKKNGTHKIVMYEGKYLTAVVAKHDHRCQTLLPINTHYYTNRYLNILCTTLFTTFFQ